MENFDLNIPWKDSLVLRELRTELSVTLSLEGRRYLPGEVVHCLLEKGISDKFQLGFLFTLSTESVLAYIFVMVY